jgi:signal transduction histidine kinase
VPLPIRLASPGSADLLADATAAPSPGLSIEPSPPADVRVRWVEFERRTGLTLALVAVLAVVGASTLGFFLADRVVRPLRQLGRAAAAVAEGDLARRSGLGDRADEIGELGRSFDAMAGALAASDEARRRFLQDVVHELRTPLTVIDATSAALLDGVYDLEPSHIETIRGQSQLLNRIVDDLRTLNLAEIGKLPLELDRVEVAEAIAATSSSFQAKAVAHDQRLLVLAPPAGAAVLADRDRLLQILAALTDNALRYAPPGGEITIAARPADGRIRFSVQDTGPGVAPQDLEHVFERFYEADAARDRASGHTGLGLAIVKALVEAHGGQVGVENVPGAGAGFWFELAVVPTTTGGEPVGSP